MDSDLETPRHDVDFNDTNMSHSLEFGKYQHDEPYLQVRQNDLLNLKYTLPLMLM